MLDPKEAITHAISQTIKWVSLGMLIATIIGGIAGFLVSWYFR